MTQSHEHVVATQSRNGLAIASLVLGILSLTGFSILTGIPAIITGAMGIKTPDGKGMSIAGLIMGSISVLLAIVVVAFFLIVLIIGAIASDRAPSSDSNDYAPMTPRIHQRT